MDSPLNWKQSSGMGGKYLPLIGNLIGIFLPIGRESIYPVFNQSPQNGRPESIPIRGSGSLLPTPDLEAALLMKGWTKVIYGKHGDNPEREAAGQTSPSD